MPALKQTTEIVPLNSKSGPGNIWTIFIHNKPWLFYQVSPAAQAIIFEQHQTRCRGQHNSTLKSEQTQQRTHVLGLWPFGRICAPKLFKHPWKNPVCLFFFKDQHVFWKAGNDKIAGAMQKAFVRRKIYSRMCSLQNTMFSSCIIAAFSGS